MKSIVLSAALIAALPAAANAARFDGNALQTRCSVGEVKNCEVYLQGYSAALTEIPHSASPACIPEGVTGSQLRDVILKYLHNTPEQRELPAARLIANAFHKAWPCPK